MFFPHSCSCLIIYCVFNYLNDPAKYYYLYNYNRKVSKNILFDLFWHHLYKLIFIFLNLFLS